tara:strand:+ start:301 stop:492 length:192 start_codon:yes stop_codon:yes gene_type:complete
MERFRQRRDACDATYGGAKTKAVVLRKTKAPVKNNKADIAVKPKASKGKGKEAKVVAALEKDH